MAIHSSILAWEIPGLVHGVTKESDTTYRLNDRPEQLTSKLSHVIQAL